MRAWLRLKPVAESRWMAQFLKALVTPGREIDLDAMRIEDLAVEFVRQSFSSHQPVDLGAPARSHCVKIELNTERLTAIIRPDQALPESQRRVASVFVAAKTVKPT